MVLVCEGIRNPAVEKPIVHDTTTYTANWGTGDTWTDLKSYAFTLTSDSYLHLRIRVQYFHTSGSSSTAMRYCARIKEGTSPIINLATAFPHYYSGSSTTVQCEGHGFVRLASGSHTLDLQGYCRSLGDAPTTAYTRITVTSFGIVSLSDAAYSYDLETSGVSCPSGSYTTLLSATIDAPATNRQTVLGPMKSDKYTVFIYAAHTGANQTYRNSADTTNGVYIYKDGSKMDWADREASVSFPSGLGCGVASYQATAGDSDTIELKIYPASTDTYYGVMGIILCPWIIHSSTGSFPVTLETPVGSTMRVTLEPFNAMDYCFKTANGYGFRVGSYKGVDTGLYDYSATGTGGTRVDASYTFTGMQSDDLTVVEGYGKMCIISYIALDTA